MTAATFSLREYRDTFTERIGEVESGQTHVLTKHGKPCARIVPIAGARDVAAAIQSIRASRVKASAPVRELIQEGRQ